MTGGLRFRTITVVEGEGIDEWLARQGAIDRERDLRELVRWELCYRLLGGGETIEQARRRGRQ